MEKRKYVLCVTCDVLNGDGEVEDRHTDEMYFDTRDDALAQAAKYPIGRVLGTYSDDCDAVVVSVDVSDEPVLVDCLD